ncbi:hypothetical protein HanXRQr2_Chr09g0397461 [Helianthus annuus]|uniref:Uncharacterized protein n=1 Tax=Helianthus annuus TaxID=4232 RepID=A0A9K3I715_HELAN|nr:hypothetical protein HanXRQr2_Chr09g0397461 [Helianthus annuus]KAJ0893918.1 hypothetical protein HanPSC8_Chr09g0383211 [Helianthus annuus]
MSIETSCNISYAYHVIVFMHLLQISLYLLNGIGALRNIYKIPEDKTYLVH